MKRFDVSEKINTEYLENKIESRMKNKDNKEMHVRSKLKSKKEAPVKAVKNKV